MGDQPLGTDDSTAIVPEGFPFQLSFSDSLRQLVGQIENQDRLYLAGPQGLKDDFDTIWLMRYVQPIFDPEDRLRLRIEDLDYQKKGEYDFNGVVVWRYEK